MRPAPFLLAACLTLQSVSAANFFANFDPPEYSPIADPGPPVIPNEVAGQQGWTITESPALPLSFFVEYPDSSNYAAGVGPAYDVPSGNSAELSHPVGRPLAGTGLSLTYRVVSSTQDFDGLRDTFYFHLGDSFTLSLEPSDGFADQLEIVWYDINGVRTSTGEDMSYDFDYDFDIEFSDTGFSATISGAESVAFSGTLPDAATATLDHFGAGFELGEPIFGYGDNFLIFDGVATRDVPEPALSSVFFAGVVGLLTVVRRRVGKKA